MRNSLILAMAAIAALPAGAAGAAHESTPDKLLAGRLPGKPVQCIQQNQIQDTQTFDDGSIYYRMRGRVDYVNRPKDCPLDSNKTYITRTPSNSLCAGDILTVRDSMAQIPYGSCTFERFTPYPRRK